MPKSKRDKRISLTKTGKKGREQKENLLVKVRESVNLYDRIYLIDLCNLKNNKLKEIRIAWKHSRMVFGKNSVMALALGKSEEEEIMEGIHKLTPHLKYNVGLLFTSKSREDVEDWFRNYAVYDYASTGCVSTSTVVLDEGPLKQFSHTIEPHLRKLGLPVKLERGIVTMLREYVVCKEGDLLTPEQASILKLLGIVLTKCTVNLTHVWEKETGEIAELEEKDLVTPYNVVKVSSEDQEYTYVENEEAK